MEAIYAMYKGLQKPLTYKGFKGKFIYWGIASLTGGLATGGLLGIMTNMYLGGFMTIALIAAGLALTAVKQKGGLHAKTRGRGIIIQPNRLKITYVSKPEIRI